jgi:hypothetical protein
MGTSTTNTDYQIGMTLVIKQSITVAIPAVLTECGRRNLRLVHPDILFEIPYDFNTRDFTSELINKINMVHPQSGIIKERSDYKIVINVSCPDLDLKPFTEYQNYIYLDDIHREGFLAMNTSNMPDDISDNICESIEQITGRACYQNKPRKIHPLFNMLQRRYIAVVDSETFDQDFIDGFGFKN